MANRHSRQKGGEYALSVVSLDGGPVPTVSGVRLLSDRAGDVRRLDTLIVSGGLAAQAVAEEPATIDWIRRTALQSRRTCSVCTGAFLLAGAGLLDGRNAVTHWDSGPEFRRRYPAVSLDLHPIYVRDGPIWTSAGVAAGIDLALALVEDDLGRSMAIAVAKQLVVFLQRPGSQAQFSSTLSAQTRAADHEAAQKIRDLHAWIAEDLSRDLSIPALAEHVRMAPRSFARLYTNVMGLTPGKAVENLRLEAAQRALENSRVPVKTVAGECGFGNEERLRRSFCRRFKIAPSEYRERFGRRFAP